MRKFLIGFVAGIFMCGLSLVILFFAAVKLADRKPAVAAGSTLIFRLEGETPEVAPLEIPIPFYESQSPLTMVNVYELLRRAGTDSRIKALVFEPRGTALGWAKMDEVRQGLAAYKKSGKPLIVFLRNPTTREYYMSSGADKIYMTAEDVLDMKGLRIEAMFVKDALGKLGVQMEFEHVGKFKDYGDMFTRNGLTPESRQQLSELLDGIYGNLISAVAAGRRKKAEEVRAAIDQGPFVAADAVKAGLVDELLYEDEVFDRLKKQLGQSELTRVSHREYLKAAAAAGEAGRRIALIAGDGAITRGGGESGFGTQDGIASTPFIRLLRQVGGDASIRGVILRVDSPGGDAIASDDILREVKLLAKKKPLVISMSDVAASGGYYISAVQEPIIAYPDTITGSIGVVYGKLNLRGLYDKIGIQKEILERGQNAGLDTDYGPLKPEARAKLRLIIESTYHTFVSHVAEARKKRYDEIDALAQGRVWLGSAARRNGLVDELGGIDKAVEVIRKKANLASGDRVRLVAYPPRKSVVEQLFSHGSDAAFSDEIRKFVRGFDWALWSRGGLMRVLPYRIEIR